MSSSSKPRSSNKSEKLTEKDLEENFYSNEEDNKSVSTGCKLYS